MNGIQTVQPQKDLSESSTNHAHVEKYIRKVTWVGLTTNVLLSVFKFAAGVMGASRALVADAIHSLSDITTDIVVIVGSYYWSRPPDKCHPYGHQRMETVVTIFIGILLLAAGAGIGWEAMVALHQKHTKSPGMIALIAAVVSIACKEILYRWTAAAGMRVKSSALAANAWHHRTDAISSLPVLMAVGGALLFPSWAFLDRVGAALVSIFIIHSALKIIWPGLHELVDSGAPADVRQKIKGIALHNPGVRQVHGLRTRYISSSIQIDIHIVVDGMITVFEGHAIADDVKDRIMRDISDVLDVVVHVDPA
jgi:cation diffusion facilitator family transporter